MSPVLSPEYPPLFLPPSFTFSCPVFFFFFLPSRLYLLFSFGSWFLSLSFLSFQEFAFVWWRKVSSNFVIISFSFWVSCLLFAFKPFFLIFVFFPHLTFHFSASLFFFQNMQVKNLQCLVKRGVATYVFLSPNFCKISQVIVFLVSLCFSRFFLALFFVLCFASHFWNFQL